MRPLAFAAISFALLLPTTSADAGERYFDSNGVRIRYTIDGAGEPLVLIHGYRASADMNWRLPGATRLLARSYRVIALDCRGHGRSDRPTRVEAYGVEMVRDVVRLLDHLKLESAHVAGYSMGGMIALKLVAMHPTRVRSAMIGGMGWTQASSRPAPTGDVGSALVACRRAFGALGITRAELARIEVPLTFVVGAQDGLRRRAELAKAVRPDVGLELVPGANHVSCVFNRQYLAAIKAFVDRHAGANKRAADDERPLLLEPGRRYY